MSASESDSGAGKGTKTPGLGKLYPIVREDEVEPLSRSGPAYNGAVAPEAIPIRRFGEPAAPDVQPGELETPIEPAVILTADQVSDPIYHARQSLLFEDADAEEGLALVRLPTAASKISRHSRRVLAYVRAAAPASSVRLLRFVAAAVIVGALIVGIVSIASKQAPSARRSRQPSPTRNVAATVSAKLPTLALEHHPLEHRASTRSQAALHERPRVHRPVTHHTTARHTDRGSVAHAAVRDLHATSANTSAPTASAASGDATTGAPYTGPEQPVSSSSTGAGPTGPVSLIGAGTSPSG